MEGGVERVELREELCREGAPEDEGGSRSIVGPAARIDQLAPVQVAGKSSGGKSSQVEASQLKWRQVLAVGWTRLDFI